MANLYLIDRPLSSGGLTLAQADDDAIVVLIQDGVYLDAAPLCAQEKEVYVLRPDVERRGLGGLLPPAVKVIDYSQLVDLVVQNRVVNFA